MLHVTDYLWEPSRYPIPPVCVLFGGEVFLKFEAMKHLRNQVLDAEDAEFSFTRFEGGSLSWPRLVEELSTVAMFGGGRRLVLVEDADTFVSKHRPELEDYVASPSAGSVLLLQLQTFASNTNLYKKVLAKGFPIDCSAVAEKHLPKWIQRWSKQRHQTGIDPAAAELLVQLAGNEMGLLDQEMAKLSLLVEKNGTITTGLVEASVGSWRSRTTFEMLDFALEGKTAEALRQLAQLVAAGENPVGILAQIAASLRKMAAATRLILDAEKNGKKLPVPAALAQAGVNKFFLEKTERHLRALGRARGMKLLGWLLETDLALKGGSRADPRFLLETFIIRLSHPALKGR